MGLSIDVKDSLKSRELIVDSELFKSVTLLFLLSEEAFNTGFHLLGSLAVNSSVDFVAVHHLGGDERPFTVAVLEHVSVGVMDDVDIQVATKDLIIVHGFGSDLTDFLTGTTVNSLELKESIALSTGSLLASSYDQLGDIAELFKETLQFLLVETSG